MRARWLRWVVLLGLVAGAGCEGDGTPSTGDPADGAPAVADAAPGDAALVTVPDAREPTCGDGEREGAELCDDGAANGTPGHCKADCSGYPARVAIEGDVFAFMNEVRGERLAGVTVSMLEHPDRVYTTGPDGHFEFADLEEGSEVTLVGEKSGYVTTQTATIVVGPHGIDPFSIQMPSDLLFTGMRLLLGNPDLDEHCAIALTVTRIGGSLYLRQRQGIAGATVAITPAVPEGAGPIYFNESVLPDTGQETTTVDGGVCFREIPPGDYTITGELDGMLFEPVRIKCTAGRLVNAGPTLGLQSNVRDRDLTGWRSYPDDGYTAALDALCEKTAECVNQDVTDPPRYPDLTLTGCKHAMRNGLSWIDLACDATAQVRDAWKTLADCRAATCDAVLASSEDVCVAEEEAFNSAQLAYAPCYTAAHADP